MKKGIDFTGIAVSFSCHDGKGNYLFHKRGVGCRDEQGRWDCGGGGLKFNERLIDALYREVEEEYAELRKDYYASLTDRKYLTLADARAKVRV